MIQTWKKPQKQKLLNRLKPSKKAETNGDRACEVLVFVRSLEGPVLKPRQIKSEKKKISSTESVEDISRSSHISDSIAVMGHDEYMEKMLSFFLIHT